MFKQLSDLIFKNKRKKENSSKWENSGLLDGLSDDAADNLSILLDSQTKLLRNELLNTQTQVADLSGFNKIAFPLVRRVFAQLLTNSIVSVQPMTGKRESVIIEPLS